MAHWTLLTNHGAVLLCIAEDPTARMRDLAGRLGITERAVQRIVADLVEAGYVSSRREGRRNVYQVHPEMPFRRHISNDHTVAELLKLVSPNGSKRLEAAET
jgi:DNA-binding transcriptional ArsR family regulator